MDEIESRSRAFVAEQKAAYESVATLPEFWRQVDRIREQRAWLKGRRPELDYEIGAAALAAWKRLMTTPSNGEGG